MLNETRRLGYGERVIDFGGDFNKPRSESDDGRLSIAVPIAVDGEVIAGINLTWNCKVATTENIVKMHLTDLRQAAQEISDDLRKA
ncbi:DNA-binding transcriptional activator MhpR [compost metagenome]